MFALSINKEGHCIFTKFMNLYYNSDFCWADYLKENLNLVDTSNLLDKTIWCKNVYDQDRFQADMNIKIDLYNMKNMFAQNINFIADCDMTIL